MRFFLPFLNGSLVKLDTNKIISKNKKNTNKKNIINQPGKNVSNVESS